MEEIWETIKSTKSQSGITINTEISNKANVRINANYNDIHIATYNLSLGKGLYCDYNNHNILIAKCSGNIYRYVYFMKYTKHQYIKGWQIHHIDYNHCNNTMDNLYYCSPKEHGKFHKFEFKLGNENQGYLQTWTDTELNQLHNYNKALEYYKWLDDNKEYFDINNAHIYIHKIRNEIEQLALPIIKQYKIDKQKEIEKNRLDKQQQIYIDKLNSGKYIEVDGKLKRVMSEYQKQRMAEGRRSKCYNNTEWRRKVSEGNRQYQKNKHLD